MTSFDQIPAIPRYAKSHWTLELKPMFFSMITEPPTTLMDLRMSPLELQKGQNGCVRPRFWVKWVISSVAGGGWWVAGGIGGPRSEVNGAARSLGHHKALCAREILATSNCSSNRRAQCHSGQKSRSDVRGWRSQVGDRQSEVHSALSASPTTHHPPPATPFLPATDHSPLTIHYLPPFVCFV
jgi:hypothetical protein